MKKLFYIFVLALHPSYIKTMDHPNKEETECSEWEVVPDEWHIVHRENRTHEDLLITLDSVNAHVDNQTNLIKDLTDKLENAQKISKQLQKKDQEKTTIINKLLKENEEQKRKINRIIRWSLNKYQPKCLSILLEKSANAQEDYNIEKYRQQFSTTHNALLESIKINSLKHIEILIPLSTQKSLHDSALNALYNKRRKALVLFLNYTKQKYPDTHENLLQQIRNTALLTHDMNFLQLSCPAELDKKHITQAAHSAIDNCFENGLQFLLDKGAAVLGEDHNDPSQKALFFKAMMLGDSFTQLIMNHINKQSNHKNGT